MEELDELKQLLNFYRQKSSELELQNLQLQIKINNLSNKNSIPEEFID